MISRRGTSAGSRLLAEAVVDVVVAEPWCRGLVYRYAREGREAPSTAAKRGAAVATWRSLG